MKINFKKQLSQYQLAYAIDDNNNYCASIDNWNHSFEVVNIKTGLVIGRFCDKTKKFARSWGFRKDLGKNGRVLSSIKKN